MAFELPDKPSPAVLPILNMRGDPRRDYVAGDLTENVIATLSKLDEMLVIARTSTLVYRGKPVKVQRVAEELARTFATEWLKVLYEMP